MAPAKKTATTKSSAKRGTKKTTSTKKTTRKKKKQSSNAKPLLLAFVAGLIIACAGIWFLRDVSFSSLLSPSSPQKQTVATATKGKQTKEKTPAKPPKKAAAPKSTKQPGRDRPANDQPAVTAPLGSANAGANVAGSVKSGTKEQEASAIACALQDLQNLAYEEDLAHPPLPDRVRQVDYAIMQAAWINKLPPSAVRQVFTEDRRLQSESYTFQRIGILPGKSSSTFVNSLRDCLALWADGASVSTAGGRDIFNITVGGAITHTLRLYPGADVFPKTVPEQGSQTEPLGPQVAQRPPVAPVPGMAKPRIRGKNEAPKLVIVIDDLGESPSAVKTLLSLNYPVTFAFWPHGSHTKEGARAAHAKGQEIIVHQPMEPMGYPKVKPGPNVLLTGMSEGDIRRVLERSIAAVPYAIGLNNHMGSRFTQSAAGVGAVIRFLQDKRMFMLDSFTHSNSVFIKEGKRRGLEHYRRNVFLDTATTKENVLNELRRAERIARFTGQAVAIGHPHPATLAGLKEWQKTRDKNVRIVRLRDIAQE